MDFTALTRMWLISAIVFLTVAHGTFAAYATLYPVGLITVTDGTNKTLNCTLTDESSVGHSAANLRWQICRNIRRCDDIATSHNVEVVDDRTSLLHLHELAMPLDPANEGQQYWCSLDPAAEIDYVNFADTSVQVYIGLPPYRPKNLRCYSRNTVQFTCTWEDGGYTGISITKTFFEYRLVQNGGDWTREVLKRPDDTHRFSGNVLQQDTMEIRVTQENKLGNNTARTSFSAALETIPNPPYNLSLKFLQDTEDNSISLKLSWDLPKQWLVDNAALLEYMIQYKDSTMQDFQTVEQTVDYSRRYTIDGVTPYTNYTARVACKLSGPDQWSKWSPLVTRLSPESVPSGEVVGLSQRSLSTNRDPFKRNVLLTWQPPLPAERNGIIRGYMLNLPMFFQPIQFNQSAYELKDLDKFYTYHVTVAAFTTEDAVGPSANIEIPDLTTKPSQVKNVKVASPTPDSLNITWDAPSNPRGVILEYRVTWNKVDHPTNIHNLELEPDATSALIPGLEPYSEYTITVVRSNKAGTSPLVEGIATTQFAKPTQPLNLEHHRASPSKLELSWELPDTLNGPFLQYEIRYHPNDGPAISPMNKSVSVRYASLMVNCSGLVVGVSFTFHVLACTGTRESDKLCGPPAVLEQEMCGLSGRDLKVVFGIAVPTIAFCIMLLAVCLRCVLHSKLAKSPPDPYFIDGILDSNFEKFNSRHATRQHEKEDYDTLKTCETGQELTKPGLEGTTNKGSLTSSTGSSTDQGFHEMAVDAEQSRRLARCSSSYQSIGSQSDSDLDQKQRMLSPRDEEDHPEVFDCPEDVDDMTRPVNSYKTRNPSETEPLRSPAAIRILMGDVDRVQYTSKRESPLFTSKRSQSPSASPPTRENRFSSSGSDSGSHSYHQMGVDFSPSVSGPHHDQMNRLDSHRKHHNSGGESEPSYSQMALEEPALLQTPVYQSVWPSQTSPKTSPDTSPDTIDPIVIDMDNLHNVLGINNNNKEIPNIHAGDLNFSPPQDLIVATALSPQTPTIDPSVPTPNPALLRLASAASDDYIDMVGCTSSLPQTNNPTTHDAPQDEFAPKPPSPCNDYVLQSELPPASPKENSVLN